MRVGSYNFAPTLWPTLATIGMMALTFWLGQWQLHRAEYKRTLQDRFDSAKREAPIHIGAELIDGSALDLRRVEADGTFEPKYQIYLDNRVYRERPGFYVYTPLKLPHGDRYVLINRGWMPLGADRTQLPKNVPPAGAQHIEGIATVPPAKLFELGTPNLRSPVWTTFLLQRYQDAMRIPLQPVVVLQLNETHDGLIRDWPRPDTGVDKHLGYAFQWFSLCLALLAIYVIVNTRRSPAP